MRLAKTAVGVAGLLACLIVGASVALGAGSSATPAGGRIQLFVQPGNGQGKGKILFTGAVGDYGSSSPTESSGANKFGVATLKRARSRSISQPSQPRSTRAPGRSSMRRRAPTISARQLQHRS